MVKIIFTEGKQIYKSAALKAVPGLNKSIFHKNIEFPGFHMPSLSQSGK
jgi:hypothetical protein